MRPFACLAATALLAGACGVAAPAPATPVPLATPGQPAPARTAPAAQPAPATSATPQPAAFMAMTLTDVRSGERFTLADFKGKVTIVEGMAVW